ncbi:MAG: sensor histidine kinase [Propionibacteriaceae bacterium]
MILVAAVVGLVVGAVVGGWLVHLRTQAPSEGPVTVPAAGDPGTSLSRRSLELMHLGVIVVDTGNDVVIANRASTDLKVATAERLDPALVRLARRARHDGRAYVEEMEIGSGSRSVGVRAEATPLGPSGHVAVFVQDLSESRRVDAVRRDFVANVSHELKTPVGALALLAEAILDGYDDDPDDVRRFALRLKHEATRLSRLVQDLIDLSRLQGAENPAHGRVQLDRVIAEAVDRGRPSAQARRISVITCGDTGVVVSGAEGQLITAVANLVDNAVAYSPDQTRVVVSVQRDEYTVDISVTDQGIGIAETDLERVFERFYRADPARSRATGGTGLGLAIVKHVAGSHGGDVRVWSVEGNGSTFTLRLPAVAAVDRRSASSSSLEKGIA